MSEAPNRQYILDQMKLAIREDGKPPGTEVFAKKWGVKRTHRARYWATHSKLVEDAGERPNEALGVIPEEEIFGDYARVCLHYGHIPTLAELRIATRELATRTHTVQSRFGTLAEFNRLFKEWLSSQAEEHRAILAFAGWGRAPFVGTAGTTSRSKLETTPAELDVSKRPFLPYGLRDLHILAENCAAHRADESPASVIFERSCADAFRAMGFQIRPLGQGKGRVADCLAIARSERYAVVIDAKARQDGFVLGTEDRKLLEYAKHHTLELQREGILHVYLCVISSSFREKDCESLRHVFKDSGLRGFSLWPALVLMTKVEESIRGRSEFSLSSLEADFFRNAVVAE